MVHGKFCLGLSFMVVSFATCFSVTPLAQAFGSRRIGSTPLAQAFGSRRIGSRVTATDSDSVLLEGVGVSSQLKLADLIGRELL